MRLGTNLEQIRRAHEMRIQQNQRPVEDAEWQKLPAEATATLVKNNDGSYSVSGS